MSIDWTVLAEVIEAHNRFLVTTHVRPDGDALGSEVGMAGLLREMGKDVRIVNASRTPPRYDFLDDNGATFEHLGSLSGPVDFSDREALIILDLSSWSQLGEMADHVRAFPGPRLVIDHHVSQDDLGALAYLKDTSAEATGTLVLRAARALGVRITREMARGLLTAIAMDTGWFHHPNTTASTMRDAAELMERGAEISAVYRMLFERNTVSRLKMMGESLAALQEAEGGRIIYTTVTRESLSRTGAIPADSEDLVDFTVSVAGAEIGLLFIEQARGGVKISVRSRGDFDCAAVAREFGGGGHRAAAGATIEEPLEVCVERVLAAVRGRFASSDGHVFSRGGH